MSYTGVENNRILIDLTQAARSSGWSAVDGVATHDSCVSGNLYLLNYPLTIGQAYRYTFQINYVTTPSYVTTNFGMHQTVAGLVDETFTANDTQLYFFSNGGCQIQDFAIEVFRAEISDQEQNTIAWSEKLNKWTSFYTYIPESVFSLFTKSYPWLDGQVYVQEANTADRCNFFGVQYPATIYFSTNQQPSFPKTYESITYQANQLLITPPSGINTANGQVSELIPIDFLQQVLADGSSPSIFIYEVENMRKASFMRAIPDIIEGEFLQGNWLQMGLQTTSPSGILALFTTEINYVHSYSNTR